MTAACFSKRNDKATAIAGLGKRTPSALGEGSACETRAQIVAYEHSQLDLVMVTVN